MAAAPSPLTAEHTRVAPVFVLGHPRSGTSLTCRLLLDYLGVNFGTESQFIVRYYRRLRRYGNLHDDHKLRRLFEDISHERFFERTRHNFGFRFDVDRAMSSITDRTYGAALRTIFEQFAASKGLARWGDKTPEYSHHLHVLGELFPDAQFLHIVRDGRDVAASMFKAGFGAKTAYEAARGWRDAVERIQRFGREIPPEQFFEFRYEDLLEEPAATLGHVAEYLGIRNPGPLISTVRDRLRVQVRRENFGKWRDGALDTGEIECFEAVAGEQLASIGYALHFPPGSRRVGHLEATGWRVLGVCRRVWNRKYWSDNWYKLGLRVRGATLPVRTLSRPFRTLWRPLRTLSSTPRSMRAKSIAKS